MEAKFKTSVILGHPNVHRWVQQKQVRKTFIETFLKIVLGNTGGTPWTADEGEGCTLDFIKVLKSIDSTISKVST